MRCFALDQRAQGTVPPNQRLQLALPASGYGLGSDVVSDSVMNAGYMLVALVPKYPRAPKWRS